MIIYKIENKINGKCYIGQTIRNLDERVSEHLRKNYYIGRALNKYGLHNFDIDVIDYAESIDELNSKECFYIEKYNSMTPQGYNLCDGGGRTLGFKHTEESKKSMSNNKKGKYTGEDNHFYGKKHTEATKEKMRLAWKTTRIMTEEQKEKLRKAHVTKQVINLDTGDIFNSCKEAGASINVNPTQITRVCKGRSKTSGGYHWMYYEEYMKISCQA